MGRRSRSLKVFCGHPMVMRMVMIIAKTTITTMTMMITLTVMMKETMSLDMLYLQDLQIIEADVVQVAHDDEKGDDDDDDDDDNNHCHEKDQVKRHAMPAGSRGHSGRSSPVSQ